MILQMLQEDGYDLSNLSAVVGRGGMVYDLAGGGYKVNKNSVTNWPAPRFRSMHPAWAGFLAYMIAEPLNLPAYIYDSTMGCDLLDVVKLTGIAGAEKYGATHLFEFEGAGYQICGFCWQRL